METSKGQQEYYLQKYLLLLATVVATVAYAAAFNPPGGTWQVTDNGYLGDGDGGHKGHLAGEPIIRSAHYPRYLLFFYCNAAAFASSIVVIILILVLAIWHDMEAPRGGSPTNGRGSLVYGLRVAMVLDLVGLMGAYAAGTSQDEVAMKIDWALLVAFFVFVVVLMVWWYHRGNSSNHDDKSHHKVLMVLATFITSITYTSGLSMPGGFWDSSQGGHSAGDPILQGNHLYRLRAFFFCNTMSFTVSLLFIVLLMAKQMLERWKLLYPYIALALLGLVGAYAFGSCRETDNTVYVAGLLAGAFLLFLLFWVIIHYYGEDDDAHNGRSIQNNKALGSKNGQAAASQQAHQDHEDTGMAEDEKSSDRARSLVEQLAVLAATVTYQAGLVPPGGVWQDNQGGHRAGVPILLSTDPKRYKVFFYCNSMTFVVSLVVIISARFKSLLKGHALEMTMMLDLFGLMGAYAAGSCRDVSTSMIIVALVGAVLVYMVIHVGFFPLQEANGNNQGHIAMVVRKRRKMLLLLAVLGVAVTYQAGLAPPGGFQQSGHHLGDPVLLHNYPRRYNTFFYCNSVTFASSIALIILLVSPNMYRSAIASYALHICTAAGMFGLVGAFAAGSTQHLDTSFYILVLVGVVLCVVVLLLLIYYWCKGISSNRGRAGEQHIDAQEEEELDDDINPKNLMMLGVTSSNRGGTSEQHTDAREEELDDVNPKNLMMLGGTSSNRGGASEQHIDAREEELDDANPKNLMMLGGTSSNRGGTSEQHTDAQEEELDDVNPKNMMMLGGTSSNRGGTSEQHTDAQVEELDDVNPKNLMMLGVLAASIAYQAGLNPPGGVWQDNSGGHAAGDPVMHDNGRHRYTAFFYSNSASFVASVAFIILLLWEELHKNKRWLTTMQMTTMVVNLLCLLGAYAAGSTTEWETCGHVIALLVPALFCIAFQMLPLLLKPCNESQMGQESEQGRRELPGSSSSTLIGVSQV